MRFESVALAQSLITPQLGQLVNDNFGPASNIVIAGAGTGTNVSTTIISASVPLIAGQGYLVTARFQGQVASPGSVPTFINAQLNDSNNLIAPGPGSAYVMSLNQAALVVGAVVVGGISTQIFTATSGPDIFTLIATLNGVVGANVNVGARTCEITVVRNQ